MDVIPFTDQHAEVAALVGQATIDAGRFPDLIAVESGTVVGSLRRVDRPDGRTFLQMTGPLSARAALVDAVDASPLCVGVAEEEEHERWMASELGFEVENVLEDFRVPFAAVERFTARSWLAPPMEIVSVTDVPIDQVVELDTELRGSVPGVSGWRSDRALIEDEFADDDFDPHTYLVARAGEQLTGLVRIWRTSSGPKFGIVGVLPAHRRTTTAAALCARALRAASTWGFDSFTAAASTSNPVTHPLLIRLGGVSEGRSLQMRRD